MAELASFAGELYRSFRAVEPVARVYVEPVEAFLSSGVVETPSGGVKDVL
jgi:hypothetical protein